MPKFLVDANVLSEVTRPRPDDAIIRWLRANEGDVAVDPIILGEIRFGIHLLAAGAKRRKLEKWFDSGVARIHCISWDANTGLRWAKLIADLRKSGKSMPIKDSMIAATALTNKLVVVTRNGRDFKNARIKVLDPFTNQ